MTGNQSDGKALASADPGTPTPASSTPASPAPSNGEVPPWFKQYTEQLDTRLTGMEQSFKTTQGQARRTESEFRNWMSEVDKLEKSGLSRDEAIAELEADQKAGEWRSGIEKQLQDIVTLISRSGTQENKGQAVAKVFESIGLDPKDPRVASALLTQYKSADEVELAAYRLQRQIQQSPNPNPAQDASLRGGGVSGNGKDAILDELYLLQRDPTPQNAQRRQELVRQLETLG